MVNDIGQLRAWRDSAVDAAAVAAEYIAERALLRHEIVWEEKSATDFVSSVDVGAEERIRSLLADRIPGIRFVGEELGADGAVDDGLVAIIDPLDGTTNFLHGYPAYCVSVAIAMDGVPVAACIHDVARGGVYHAHRGGGAFRDRGAIRVSRIDRPARALLGTGIPFKDTSVADAYLAQVRALMPLVSGMRRGGSAALDLVDVACGRFDAFWELMLNPWDYAAGLLLIQEAGGRVTDLDGRPLTLHAGPVAASNTALHDWFLETLSNASRGR